ncbi:MAG TPA: TldD/PmbA family protein [Dehalococcoidia bacterium]|nr:TldD/PmbA family protein [Dehalococcoidia bacterium]
MRDVALRALDTARSRGASYADVRIVHHRSQNVTVRMHNVEGLVVDESLGFGVRVLVDGYWGFAASNILATAEADRVAAEAVKIARASAQMTGRAADLGPPVRTVGRYVTPIRTDPFDVPLQDKIALLLRSTETMLGVTGVVSAEGNLYNQHETKTFVSSEGAFIEQELYETGCGLEATAVDEGEVQNRSYPNSVGRHQGTEGWEFVERYDLPGNAGRIAEEAVALLSAKPCPPGVTTVILDGSQVALQIHESCGHAIELDRVLGTEAAFAGTSFLTTEKLGSFRYGSDLVNLTADATIPGGLGSFGFDDEGVPAQHTPVVRNGLFLGYLTSRETAAALGATLGARSPTPNPQPLTPDLSAVDPRLRSGLSQGAMRADSWRHIPLIRMTNVSLEPGDWTLDDLIADTQDGIYMETNRSWSIDDKRLNFQFGTELAREIKDGKLGDLVKNATYTGITPQFWGSCDAIVNRDGWTVWGTPNCGKGQPEQVAHTGHGASAARFRNIQVGLMQ